MSSHAIASVPDTPSAPENGGYDAGGEQRAAPQHRPYCGEEDLYPDESFRHAWNRRTRTREFDVSFAGLKPGVRA